jgi:DNA adenine methylase
VIIRYPGGKRKIAKTITNHIIRFYQAIDRDYQYREPFFGAGAIGFELLQRCPEIRDVWFNDRDPALCCVWDAIVNHRHAFDIAVNTFTPNVSDFFDMKERLKRINTMADVDNPAVVAFCKVALHQMSYSGLGTMAGSPIGGKTQKKKDGTPSNYLIDCRYNPSTLMKNADKASRLLGGVKHPDRVCTCVDFEDAIRAKGDAFFYLDPPYFEKGPELYQFSFDMEDHERLRDALKGEERPWLLSYDAHGTILDWYEDWCHIERVPLAYTINGAVRKEELLISNQWRLT